jgi:hypothetical protein
VVVAALGASGALAAPWCGTPTTENRPPAVAGRTIRVVYAYPSDAADRSAERAAQISADADEIDAWWRAQDPEREPRFDRAAFACGPQVDLFVLKLPLATAALGGEPFDQLADAVLKGTNRTSYEKDLVYYDGPAPASGACGQAYGSEDGEGVAIVFLAACPGVPTAATAAHEILHAFGALAQTGPPHACPDTKGHPCDSRSDVLYPDADTSPLGALVLDAGRDDYYGHSGNWLDTQDSSWLRLVTRQVSLSTVVTGNGSVESDVPGIQCVASCVTEWDPGSAISLEPTAAPGQRFVRWSGGCSGAGLCSLTLSAPQSVTALFAPARFGLVITLAGQGSVAGAGAVCRVSRCQRSLTSYSPIRLRATPRPGWRFTGWAGGCKGTAATCSVAMQKATAVRARFVKR